MSWCSCLPLPFLPMQNVARKFAAALNDKDLPGFRAGFHAHPSMPQLHLHVISQDLDSPCLKTKHHYNSFVTPFFLDLEGWVLPRLERDGALSADQMLDMARHLSRPLQCHRCGAGAASMPELKRHLHTCQAAVQGIIL